MNDKKTPADYPQIKFRPGKDLEAELASRSDEQSDSAYSQTAKRDLGRYYTLLSRSLPSFSEKEALVLANVLNGARNAPDGVHLLYAGVDIALEENPVEGINRGAFVARLRNLHRFECMAIADAVERAWSGSYHIDNLSERLRQVGLAK